MLTVEATLPGPWDLPGELAAVDALLDDPVFLAPTGSISPRWRAARRSRSRFTCGDVPQAPVRSHPGGFRVWWRRWHDGSDQTLDNTHLMRLAGRFARRVRAFAHAHGIPVIDCKGDERKHRIAEDYPREHAISPACS